VEKKESTNNYLNQSQKVLESNLDKPHKDVIFIFNIERCLSSFADEILQSSNLNISEFDKYNFEIKWDILSRNDALKNIIDRDINNIIKSIKALDKNNTEDKNIIISSDPGLKKPEMILNKFKETISLLRNLLEEC
jgi:hypothetical protein